MIEKTGKSESGKSVLVAWHDDDDDDTCSGMVVPNTLLYSHNTNTSGNIIKHNLWTSRNKQTHFFIKNISLTLYSRKGWCFVLCERWVERHILWERTSSSHIFFQEPGSANACTPLQARQRRLWSAVCPSLNCDSLHSV